ncbi:RNase A-like domain-containing protein [Nitrospirillum pindoramense]|uniref:Uncharacterized protein DUF4225 n=1 Tax=Nitrospirillum amazonense TaxID=28077 RepID=A0A560GK19_9PROT|nr:RNase A-like domain-containing protein [Nitrospirillum amazonense]TWB34318.1 uncharacterized protein DUF4225 [Nitrospirillum amazonense]
MLQAQQPPAPHFWPSDPFDFIDDSEKESGLSIIISPVQMAAILRGLSIEPTEADTGWFMTRAFGALEIVGGALEYVAAGALIITPEPTMLTKVTGWLLAFDGADNVNTGLHDLWTGDPHNTMSYRAVRAAAEGMGLSPDTADKVGVAVEIAVPLGIAAKWAALRIISIRNGWINVAVEDDAGGHIIERHVRRDEIYLKRRLAEKPRMQAASTFTTRTDAEKFISQAMQANAQQIQQWAASSGRTLTLKYSAGQSIGWVLPRATMTMQRTSEMVVVLRRATSGNRVYFVLTAYPTL